jgi:hypothetical protein
MNPPQYRNATRNRKGTSPEQTGVFTATLIKELTKVSRADCQPKKRREQA